MDGKMTCRYLFYMFYSHIVFSFSAGLISYTEYLFLLTILTSKCIANICSAPGSLSKPKMNELACDVLNIMK